MHRLVGPFSVSPLLDASGPFFLSRHEAFPQATEADWAAARQVDPGAFGEGAGWLLDFRCFLVRGPGGRVVLVDAGVGPPGSPAAAWAPAPGRLPAALADAGVAPGDVDTVVLTHLHSDHVGWSVGPAGTPTFPRARYVVQRRELEELPAGDAVARAIVRPLRATGQLDPVDGEHRLVAARPGGSLTLLPTPGHTPGHQSVLVEGDAERLLLTGDALVHAVQMVNPEIGYRFEADQELARHTRRALLDRAPGDGTVLATAHQNRPFL